MNFSEPVLEALLEPLLVCPLPGLFRLPAWEPPAAELPPRDEILPHISSPTLQSLAWLLSLLISSSMWEPDRVAARFWCSSPAPRSWLVREADLRR